MSVAWDVCSNKWSNDQKGAATVSTREWERWQGPLTRPLHKNKGKRGLLILQAGNAGQILAFQEFKACTAAGGDDKTAFLGYFLNYSGF